MGGKKTKGGNKARMAKKRAKREANKTTKKTRLELPGDDQCIAKVTANNSTRWTVQCSDNIQRSARMPGRLKRRCRIFPGDIVLVTIGITGKENVCEFSRKYRPDEIRQLQRSGYISFLNDDKEIKQLLIEPEIEEKEDGDDYLERLLKDADSYYTDSEEEDLGVNQHVDKEEWDIDDI